MLRISKNYFYPAVILGAAIGGTVGCAATDGNQTPEVILKQESLRGAKTTVAVSNVGATESGTDGTHGRGKKTRDADRREILTDGSEYVLMKDGYGNKTEYRYFEPGDFTVKYVSVQTLADGTETMFVRTWNGDLKRAKPSQIENPWRTSPRDIALRVGISPDYRPRAEDVYSAPLLSPSSVVEPLLFPNEGERRKDLKQPTPPPAAAAATESGNSNVKLSPFFPR